LTEAFELEDQMAVFEVPEDSNRVGQTPDEVVAMIESVENGDVEVLQI